MGTVNHTSADFESNTTSESRYFPRNQDMTVKMDWEPEGDGKWERNISLVLAAILLLGGGIGAYFFIVDRPTLEATTHPEVLAAERWIRVLLTIFWIGFSVCSVLGVIFLSVTIEKTSRLLEKGSLAFKRIRRLGSTQKSI